MSFIKACSDDPLLKVLRNLFNAVPVRVPEERIQPLCVVASKGDSSSFRGQLYHLFDDNGGFNIEIANTQMSDISGKKSMKIDTAIGLSILEGFLDGFSIPSFGIKSSFENASKVSFSFRDVKRHSVDTNLLGKMLVNRKIDRDNPAASIFFDRGSYDFLVINSVITSSDFSINVERTSDNNAKIDLANIQQIVSDASAKVQVSSSSGYDLTFKGEKHLGFAFSCLRFFIDDTDGKITSLSPTESNRIRSFSSDQDDSLYNADQVILPGQETAFIKWDF